MKTLKYFISIGIAGAAGFAIGMLTAPRKGKETRDRFLKDLNSTKSELESAALRKLNEAKKILDEQVENYNENGKKVAKKVKEVVHE